MAASKSDIHPLAPHSLAPAAAGPRLRGDRPRSHDVDDGEESPLTLSASHLHAAVITAASTGGGGGGGGAHQAADDDGNDGDEAIWRRIETTRRSNEATERRKSMEAVRRVSADIRRKSKSERRPAEATSPAALTVGTTTPELAREKPGSTPDLAAAGRRAGTPGGNEGVDGGGGGASSAARRVLFASRQRSGPRPAVCVTRVRITVTDTGVGISTEVQQTLLRPFAKARFSCCKGGRHEKSPPLCKNLALVSLHFIASLLLI